MMLCCCLASAGYAVALDVVATSSTTGALIRELAGDRARLTILAPPDRDLHFLQARPSMMRALRKADLVTALGADLEVGWLPVAIQQAANPAIQPGRPGYFEAAAQVALLGTGLPADRALGDVHPMGNPHVNLDPARMASVARALAERLAELDPEFADTYRQRARDFVERLESRLRGWQHMVNRELDAVLYHPDADYLLERLGIRLLGYLEPVPGVPPSASHISALTTQLRGKQGVILYAPFQAEGPVRSLAGATGWRTARLPLEPPLDADGDGYLDHIERWVVALTGEDIREATGVEQ